jgi:hypothetical protein
MTVKAVADGVDEATVYGDIKAAVFEGQTIAAGATINRCFNAGMVKCRADNGNEGNNDTDLTCLIQTYDLSVALGGVDDADNLVKLLADWSVDAAANTALTMTFADVAAPAAAPPADACDQACKDKAAAKKRDEDAAAQKKRDDDAAAAAARNNNNNNSGHSGHSGHNNNNSGYNNRGTRSGDYDRDDVRGVLRLGNVCNYDDEGRGCIFGLRCGYFDETTYSREGQGNCVSEELCGEDVGAASYTQECHAAIMKATTVAAATIAAYLSM